MDDVFVWTFVIVAVVLVVALLAWVMNRNLQSRRLKDRFGPEYERTVERASGDRRRAESALGERVARREQIELRPLSAAARRAYVRRWGLAQAEFVDKPGEAVQRAQGLLDEVMRERGYPVGDAFEERVDLISVDHPDVVEHYRLAHRLHQGSSETGDTAVSTEKRRQALVHYRALFAELLDTPEARVGSAPGVTDSEEQDRARRVS